MCEESTESPIAELAVAIETSGDIEINTATIIAEIRLCIYLRRTYYHFRQSALGAYGISSLMKKLYYRLKSPKETHHQFQEFFQNGHLRR